MLPNCLKSSTGTHGTAERLSKCHEVCALLGADVAAVDDAALTLHQGCPGERHALPPLASWVASL